MYCLLDLVCCVQESHEDSVTTPPSRVPGPRSEEGEVLRVVSLLRTEGGE